MLALGIVGHAAEKFDAASEARARLAIRWLILTHEPQWVISGRSPMGGIDIWAIEEARRAGVKTFEFAPKVFTWSGEGGYRDRNLKIAQKSNHVACIVLEAYPASYAGMRFEGCYHCDGQPDSPGTHVKSGGCFTARRCASREWVVL